MDNTVIVTTPAQLREIVADEVSAILPKLADFRRKNEPVETDGMTVEDAARFLTEQGIPTTRATLYSHVYKDTIPYKKFGRRIVFSKKELLAWIEARTTRPEDKRTAAALRIAQSANNHQWIRGMDQMKIAAGTRYEHAAATPDVPVSKDTQKSLAFHQKRVYNLLQSGKKYSVADISAVLRLSDPRSCIRYLRAKGISILDEWVPSEHGSRFKRYFIRKEVRND